MTEYGSSGGAAQILAGTTQFSGTIVAGTNSITITHNLGRLVRITGEPYCTDDNAQLLKIINQGVNSFDVAIPAGMLAGADTPFEGTYI